MFFFFFKQKTAYEMRIRDWSSDVCSSDLDPGGGSAWARGWAPGRPPRTRAWRAACARRGSPGRSAARRRCAAAARRVLRWHRSEEHTSELQSLMRISYAVFCLKKQQITDRNTYIKNKNVTNYITKL